MKRITMKTDFSTWDKEAARAKKLAFENNTEVEFDFNGVLCVVNANTDLTLLWRDYSNSWVMEWKEVGADCVKEYPADVQTELEARTKVRDEKRKQQEIEYARKEQEEKEAFALKVVGVEVEFKDKESWDRGLAKNTDPYGRCCYDYAENWAKLMQSEMMKGKTVIECASETSHQLGFMGITGFMYGAAVSILSACWKHGEELRKWHNKDYGHVGDGVVNPAIMTIGVTK